MSAHLEHLLGTGSLRIAMPVPSRAVVMSAAPEELLKPSWAILSVRLVGRGARGGLWVRFNYDGVEPDQDYLLRDEQVTPEQIIRIADSVFNGMEDS